MSLAVDGAMQSMSFADQAVTLRYHQGMLADANRVDRYREAIHEVVEPGDVVVDLGAGTGLLSYFACQAGAARVYAIDSGPVLRLAAELCRANGFHDRVVLVAADSTEVTLSESADVLVSEVLWNFGLGEGVMNTLNDARERFLRPGGRVVPTSFEMITAPIEMPDLHRRIALDPPDRHGLDLSPLRAYGRSNVHNARLPASALLGQPVALASFELDRPASRDVAGSASLPIERAGTLHGLGGWFSARLSPSVVLGNPPDGERSSWAQAFLPLEQAVDVEPGDRVEALIQTTGNGSVWRWKVAASGADGTPKLRSDQTTFFGFPPDLAPLSQRNQEEAGLR
ncbi:MAG TPA: 50S ribosomal protein L11 methyltransferase [Thermoleophilaceae bacterium]|nr:50S ribosomal protein L11 methyltransferase [Thermoleophilaceae bacterium]